MKKKLKKSLACLLATLLIFSALPMSALADEAAAPVTVTDEITAVEPEEAAAPDADPDAEPKPEITAEPTATPEASTTPSAEPTAVPSPEATEEPTEPETSAEPEATAEPTASPTPNPEDEISLLALGDEAVTRYRTVGINGNFSSNYLYDLGEFPLYDIYRNGVSYPAYCLQHGKGRVNNGAYVQRDNFGMTEAMRRIIAYGYNTTNSLGKNDWYSDATAKTMVTQHLVWLASEGYITVDGTNWSWGSGIDNDVERMANLAYNGSVVRSYYAELKDRLLRSEIVPSFAGKNSDGSDAQEIALQFVNGKYAATVTDTNGVLDLFDFQKAGFDISCNGNTLTISTNTLPEQETTIISAGYTVGDKNSIAVWEDRDQQANIQHQATCPGTTKTTAYIKIKGENPKYTVTLTKTSADVKITNGNANYSLEGAVYNVYEANGMPNHDYTNDPIVATFTTQKDGHATLSKMLENGDYVTIEQVAPLGYTLDTSVHRFSVDGKSTDISVVDDPSAVTLTVTKKDSDTNSSVATGNASLAGAVYRVSYLQDGSEVHRDITTNSSGRAVLKGIPIGQIKVQEISSPLGYKLDPTVHIYNVAPHEVTSAEFELEPADFTEEVMKGQIALHMEDNQLHQSYSGTPQGGIISPILANIYLDQFDKYMAEYKKRFDRGNKRAVNVEYHKLSAKRIRLKRKLAKAQSEEEKQSLLESIRELDKVHKSIPCKNPMDTNFRRLQYVRYADDFLIGIIGAKEDAQAVKQEIGVYIAEQLKLELSEEKTLVTKATDRAKFLGFDIRVTPQSNHTKKTKSGSTARNYSGHVMLEVPTSVIQKKLLELGAMRIDVRNGTEIWQPTYRGKLVGRTDLSILDQYNGEVRGFCNYYAIANNRSKLHKFRYIMEYSFYKTLACKYRTTKGKIIAQYRIVKDIGVKFQDKHGNERIRLLWKDSLARDPYPLGKEADIIHKPKGILKKPSLGARLKANRCEWCGKETSALVMHQVRTLKELDESQPWAVFMKRINRKTLVVCESCHTKIHGAGCE